MSDLLFITFVKSWREDHHLINVSYSNISNLLDTILFILPHLAEQAKEIILLQAEKNQCEQNLFKNEKKLQALQVEFETLKNQQMQLQSKQIFDLNQKKKVLEELNQLKSHCQNLQENFTANAKRLQITETAQRKVEDELVLMMDKLLFLIHEKAQLQKQLEIIKQH